MNRITRILTFFVSLVLIYFFTSDFSFTLKTQRKPIQNLLKSCLNEVQFKHNLSVWTLLTNDFNYVISAIKLLKSIQKNVKSTKFDKIVIELKEKKIKSRLKSKLIKAGWTICQINRIAPRDEEKTNPKFRDQFAKLILFNMTEYKSIVYFDSDTFIINNIDPLLNVYKKLNNNLKIAVTRDIFSGKWLEGFNMGVFSIRPNKTEFERLVALKNDKNFFFEIFWAEQGFLSKVYRNAWLEFGFEYNANLAIYEEDKEYWMKYERNISVIHYTINKPWACSKYYQHICKKWIDFK